MPHIQHLVYDHMTSSHSCCRFAGSVHDENLQLHHIPEVLDWTEIWAQWSHHHVKETSLRWSAVCDVVCYAAGSSHRQMVHCGSNKEMHKVSQQCSVSFGVLTIFFVKEPKVCNQTTPLPHQAEPLSQDGSVLSFHHTTLADLLWSSFGEPVWS